HHHLAHHAGRDRAAARPPLARAGQRRDARGDHRGRHPSRVLRRLAERGQRRTDGEAGVRRAAGMKIGFIGLGAMGAPMAASLERAGHAVQSFDLNGKGNRKSIREASEGTEVFFTSLPGPAEVDAVAKDVSAPVWFDLSTNSPKRVRALHKQFKGQLLDAPVSGGPNGAKSGKLAIWVGGDRATYDRYLPVLKAIGDQPFYVGAIGVEPVALFQAIRQGATGRKRTFDRLPEHFLNGKYDPADFTVRLAHKDVTLALELAAEVGVPMRVGKIALEELSEAMQRGWGERDCRVAM